MTAETAPAPTPARARRRPALAATLLVAALAVSGCGGSPAGQGASSSEAAAPSASAPAPAEGASAPAGLELGDRPDQRRAEAGAARAAAFGFTRQQAAAVEEIDTARQDARARATDAGRTTVAPAECKAPLAALDFSPILLDQEEVTRVDVGAATFDGTGTVEVARLDGPARQAVERHLQTVDDLLADCTEMELTVTQDGEITTYRVTAAEPELSEGTPAQSALTWRRTAEDGGDELTAQVLTAVTADEVVMVSFAGGAEAGEKPFTLMAEEILAAALAAG